MWEARPAGFALTVYPVSIFFPDHHPEGILTLRQIHSARVVDVDREKPGEGDGLFTREGRVLGVRTADCYPVVLWAPRLPGTHAVLHVGWRGFFRGILEAGVAAFPETPIQSAIGPGICGRCYTVGESFLDWARPWMFRNEQRLHLDLLRGILERLQALGVAVVALPPSCTFEDPRLPSFRRTGVRHRSLLTVVGLS